MERTTIDLWFGAFVVAGFAALLVLALKVGNLGAERATETYRVEARFDNIGGLKVRAPVRSAGVLVGRVADIHFDNERYSFPKDTSASILTSGLLGESYIGLQPGGDPDTLKPGDEIAFTQPAVDLLQLVGKYMFSGGGTGGGDKAAAPGDATDTPAPTEPQP